MRLVAGVDVGNNTTEVALARIERDGRVQFLATAIANTSGIKGTPDNVTGIRLALQEAVKKAKVHLEDLNMIRLNEATPVIADVAMETITETVITESTMIGHNPPTPGGMGLGVGRTVRLEELERLGRGERVVVIVPARYDFEETAAILNREMWRGLDVQGAIVQKDDAVLIANRLDKPIPIVDEVALIDQVPVDMPAAVEVAPAGRGIATLSDPYGIATVFSLTPEETRLIMPVARALVGNRSAVVIKTPHGDIKERRIPAGRIMIIGRTSRGEVNVDEGAAVIMAAVESRHPLMDVEGEPGTNVGGMLQRIRQVMGELTDQPLGDVKIRDLLAVDTFVPQEVRGGLAGEVAMENAVALGAMVKTSRLPMEEIARRLTEELNVPVESRGVEAEMAAHGALTTPGTGKPLAILDMGGGSTDAALIHPDGRIRAEHLAGAGDMVTMLINSELGLDDEELAEDIKRHPLARVDSLFQLRLEDGSVQFYREPLDPKLFARVVILKDDRMVPIPGRYGLEKIRSVRREAKRRVFLTNAVRALKRIAPAGNLRSIDHVVMVGGSALDFEIPGMIADGLAEYGIVVGRGNVRGTEGPRNCVATGLVLSFQEMG